MMFRQIRVDDRDTDLQRIIWRESKDETLQDFRLCTVTYGTKSAPYLAIRTLLQLAEDEGHNYPLGAEILRHEIYVDDILSGADTVADALQKQKQLIEILKSGGFLLHKWSSNNDKLLQAIDDESQSSIPTLSLNQDNVVKTLGLLWNPRWDTFGFKVTLGDPPSIITKRNLLSDVAKLYDPLGFLSPALLLAKAMFQQLWLLKVDWDSPLPDHVVQEWLALRTQLKQLELITVPRWVGCHTSSLSYEFHAFSDASEKAYSAVIYLRVLHDFNNVQVTLLCSKTKLAPIKRLSIPRLELAGAWLMARLIKTVQTSMSLEDVPTYCWCDSQTVLIWLSAHPSKWKPYVANRVSDINETVPSAKWKHVPGSCNPADLASRGVLPSKLLNNSIWWNGPSWLALPSTSWPNSNIASLPDSDLDFEERKTSRVAVITKPIEIWDLVTRYSSLDRLLRITAYCKRFGTNLRSSTNKSYFGPLTVAELNDSLVFWIKSSQQAGFPTEYDQLATGRKINIKSSILRLSPFFDNSTSTLRVGGRLQKSNLASDAKHQFLIPKNCPLANLVIANAHQQTLHGGTTLCVSYIRQRFWIVTCREKVHNFIKRCLICFRQRALAQTQLMGMLPADRVKSARPFLFSGLDYAGPVQVRYSPGRGRQAHKAYIALFVCLSTKAIHLELVSDLSTQAFIAAFKRFTARRGFCRKIYSDNAKTFVGADNELKRSFFFLKNQLPDELKTLLLKQGTDWHFIPPHAPNFGGLWEAGVKAVKHHLKRIVGKTTLTFEEFYTLLTQVEACLNSRPICPISSDPDDLEALTPGHFLCGSSSLTIPEPSLQPLNVSRLTRWQLLHHMYEHFWHRWSMEYLNNLQVRTKWVTTTPNIRLGALVLLRHDNLPPSNWALGRIVEVHPGTDGLIRVATIKTKDSIVKRPISKFCILPLPDEDHTPNSDLLRRAASTSDTQKDISS